MALQYEYHYATVRTSDGLCTGALDTSSLILSPTHVPIDDAHAEINYYFLKYYWPLPNGEVTSFDDFHGSWWTDAAHTIPLVE